MYNSLNIRDLLSAFFRQYKTFRAVFLAFVAIGVLTIVFSSKQYQATGSLLVKFGVNADVGVNKPNQAAQLSTSDRREIMQSNIDILQSHDLLEAAIKKIGVEKIYPNLKDSKNAVELAITKLSKSDLTVKSPAQTNIIDIIAMNSSPEVAAEVVHVLQDSFIARQLEIFNKPQTEFLQEQIKQAEEKLAQSQKELREFKATVGISSLEDELNELLKQKSNAATVAFQAVDDAQSKLAELRDKEAEMLSTYRSDSSELKAIRKTIAEAQRQLQDRQENLNSSSTTSELAQQNASINARINVLEEQRGKYDDLVRKVRIDEENHKNYLSRSEEARVNATLGEQKITSISVVDRPVVPDKPAKPRKKLILLSSILLGIILGGVAVLMREVFDETFRTPKQLEKALEVPVFACFPNIDELAQLLVTIENNLVGVAHPIVQFVSSYEGEGAERLAYELANLANKSGKRVRLIDTKELHGNFEKDRSQFDLIIIPNSGILRDAMGQSLAKLVSGTIIVVEAERVRAPVVQEVAHLINTQGGKVIGSVLLNRRFYIPRQLYSLLYEPTSAHNNWKVFVRVCLRWLRLSVTSLPRKISAYRNRK